MTRHRRFRRPAVLAGMLAAGLLSGCGTEGAAPSGGPDASTGGSVDASQGPTGIDPDRTDPVDADVRTLGPGEVLTPEDAGTVLRLAPGEEASLHLAPPWQDAVAQVARPAVVELVPVEHFADPGYAEYTVLARAAGASTIDVEGPTGESLNFLVEVHD